MDVFEVESCLRGHHIYEHIWTPFVGKELICTHKIENTKEPFAVSVVRCSTVVGHVLRKMSVACALFLARKGTIQCKVACNHCFIIHFHIYYPICVYAYYTQQIIGDFKFGDSEEKSPNRQIEASQSFPLYSTLFQRCLGLIPHFISYPYSRFQLCLNLAVLCMQSGLHNFMGTYTARKLCICVHSTENLNIVRSGFGHSEVSRGWSNKTFVEPTLLLVVGMKYAPVSQAHQYTKAHIHVRK